MGPVPKLESYPCPSCQSKHKETRKVNYGRRIEAGKCTAQYPQANGNWRVCHADFTIYGGPNAIGVAQLCDPCHERLVLKPMEQTTNALLKRFGLGELLQGKAQ